MTQRRPSQIGPELVRGFPAWLTVAGLVLIFTVPSSLLDLIGFGYSTSTGSALEKVHPGTDLIILAVVITAARAGNPMRYFVAQGRRFPGLVAFIAATALLIAYFIKVQRSPFTPAIDTFILPALLFPLLVDLPAQTRTVIERSLHVFLAFNAALGIVEFLSGWRLVPPLVEPSPYLAVEWRASGLLGHPLASAATAGLYAIILAMGFGRSLPGWLRTPAIALQVVSLAAFGGRTSLVMTIAGLGVLGLLQIGGILQGGRFQRRTAVWVLVLVPLASVAVLALAYGGFFDQVIDRFADDNGSAQSRAFILNIFHYLSWQEFLFGPDQHHIATILHLEGIEVGIESFWLGFITQCGLLMSGIFFIALGFFMMQVMQRADPRAWVALLFYGVIVSTTISLSAKTTSLAQFTTMVLILMPAAPRTARVPNPRPLPQWTPA